MPAAKSNAVGVFLSFDRIFVDQGIQIKANKLDDVLGEKDWMIL